MQHDPRTGWTQLEDTLTRIKPGESISVDMLVIETGLRHEMIEAVLNALAKAELFQRHEGNVFVRRRVLMPCGTIKVPPLPRWRGGRDCGPII